MWVFYRKFLPELLEALRESKDQKSPTMPAKGQFQPYITHKAIPNNSIE